MSKISAGYFPREVRDSNLFTLYETLLYPTRVNGYSVTSPHIFSVTEDNSCPHRNPKQLITTTRSVVASILLKVIPFPNTYCNVILLVALVNENRGRLATQHTSRYIYLFSHFYHKQQLLSPLFKYSWLHYHCHFSTHTHTDGLITRQTKLSGRLGRQKQDD